LTSTATHSPGVVVAHEVDRPDLRLPLAAHERQRLAERLGRGGERLLQVALDAVLLQRRRLPHVVHDVAQHLEQADLEASSLFGFVTTSRSPSSAMKVGAVIQLSGL
jgi:hypothetical protein